jgi:galactokinase
LEAGAVGVKLLGAGGGGFMLVIAAPEHHERIRQKLRSLIEVSFKIGSSGSKIVVYEEDEQHTQAADRLAGTASSREPGKRPRR